MEQYQVIYLTLMVIVGLSAAIPYCRMSHSSSCDDILSDYNSTCDDAVDQFNNLTLTHLDNVTTLGNILETVCLPVCLIPQIDYEICVNSSDTNYEDVYCIADEDSDLCYVETQRYLFSNTDAVQPCIGNTTHCNGNCGTTLQGMVDTLGCCVASLTTDNVYLNRGAFTACEIALGDSCPPTITVSNGTAATIATTAMATTTSGVASTVLSVLLLAVTSATSVTAGSGGGSTIITLTLMIAVAVVLGTLLPVTLIN